MATSIAACSSVVVTTSSFSAAAAASSSSTIEAPSQLASFTGLRPNKQQASSSSAALSVSNGSRTHCMLVWKPYDNPKFETLSYLPALTDDQVAKQVDYITGLGLIPCLEFCNIGVVYRKHFHGSGYYDGRYWTMWKLPMFGCTDSSLVLNEINECKKAYPDNYIRVLGFSAKRQVQISGFLAHKPPNVSSYTPETTSSSFPRVPSATKYRGPASSPSILPTPPPR